MKKLFFTHTIALFRVVSILLALGYSATAEAQSLNFKASDMVRMGPNSTKWRYNEVQCSGNVRVTSITISMINNNVDSLTSSIKPTNRLYSLGKNPRTNTYLFNQTLSTSEVVTFVKGIVFDQTADVKDAAQYIHLYVDANPSKLPTGAKITAWPHHPDGSVHYYVWVPQFRVSFMEGYNGAKSFYFQGRRGYMPTITSMPEDTLLTNISRLPGWSAGVRTPDNINDQKSIPREPTLNDQTGKDFKWACGPESGVVYFKGVKYGVAGWADVGYQNWERGSWTNGHDAPNNNYIAGKVFGENTMQINYLTGGWNDIPAAPVTGIVEQSGYFIEFGGNGQAYQVKDDDGKVIGSYNANPNYKTPDRPTTNAQWEGYNPGATAVSEATVKPRAMRSRVMVIE